jgi:uncharacterized protein YhhL (DUF1145 family)
MSSTKIIMLAVYAVLIAVAVGNGTGATYAAYLLAILAAAHLLEMAIFYKRCQQAGGSLPGHLLQVFLFGVVHIKDLKKTAQ